MTVLVITYCVLVLVALAGGVVIGWCLKAAELPEVPVQHYRAPGSDPLPPPEPAEFSLLAGPRDETQFDQWPRSWAQPGSAPRAERLADTGELVKLYGGEYPTRPQEGGT